MVCFLYNILFYCFLKNHLVNMHFTRLLYLVGICLGLAGPLQDSNHYHSRYLYQHQQGLSQHHQFELRENQIHSYYINSWVWDTFLMERIFKHTCSSSQNISKECIINLPWKIYGWLHTLCICIKTLMRPRKFPIAKVVCVFELAIKSSYNIRCLFDSLHHIACSYFKEVVSPHLVSSSVYQKATIQCVNGQLLYSLVLIKWEWEWSWLPNHNLKWLAELYV